MFDRLTDELLELTATERGEARLLAQPALLCIALCLSLTLCSSCSCGGEKTQ